MKEFGTSLQHPSGYPPIALPRGVSFEDWALERDGVQNPRIRCYLGCLRLIDEVLDSNYALLHCSPNRLRRVWSQTRRVGELIRTELVTTLEKPSLIPELEAARRRARASLASLEETVLLELDRYPDDVSSAQLPEARKILCVVLGKVHAFLRDSFGEIVAKDPRSRHEADYFLSRGFAEDIEESEWLYSSVYELREHLDGIQRLCSAELEKALGRMRRERMIPHQDAWADLEKILDVLVNLMIPKLESVLKLRGIRYDDLESLETYAFDIPHHCKAISEVYATGRTIIEKIKEDSSENLRDREQSVGYLLSCHEAVADRMIALISRLGGSLADLATYVPAWVEKIEKRRCLMLSKRPEDIRRGAYRRPSDRRGSDRG